MMSLSASCNADRPSEGGKQDSFRSGSFDSTRGTFASRPSSMQVDLLYGHTMSTIIENYLYLSDQQAPLDRNILQHLGISHIINASNEAVPNKHPEFIQYLNVNVEDNNEDDIYPYFETVYEFLCPQKGGGADIAASASVPRDGNERCNPMEPDTDTPAGQAGSDKVDDSAESSKYESIKTISQSDIDLAYHESKGGGVSPSVSGSEDKEAVDGSLAQDTSILCTNQNEASRMIDALGKNGSPQSGDALSLSVEENEKTILFHCRMGISRSVSLLIAFLMKSKQMSLKEAFGLVKKKRPKARPTPVFARALMKYELFLYPELEANSINMFQISGVHALRVTAPAVDSSGQNKEDEHDTLSIGTLTTCASPNSDTTENSELNAGAEPSNPIRQLSSRQRVLCGSCCAVM